MRQGIYGDYKGTPDVKRQIDNYLHAGKCTKEIASLLNPPVTKDAVYKTISRDDELRATFKETVTVRWAHPRCTHQAA
jgi:hypothetical protein